MDASFLLGVMVGIPLFSWLWYVFLIHRQNLKTLRDNESKCKKEFGVFIRLKGRTILPKRDSSP